jgi:hypothetical protein
MQLYGGKTDGRPEQIDQAGDEKRNATRVGVRCGR